MIATIHGGGTATMMARGASYMMAGKTGTAQKIGRERARSTDPRSLPYHLRHQALFVGYAPADNPQIAIAVSVEHGGYGGSTAAPIARKVFDAWLTGQMPVPEEGTVRSPQGGASLEWPLPGMDEQGRPIVAATAGAATPRVPSSGASSPAPRAVAAPRTAAAARGPADASQARSLARPPGAGTTPPTTPARVDAPAAEPPRR
jgi:penicillin-binding protein 2